jgi:hypothetical protein
LSSVLAFNAVAGLILDLRAYRRWLAADFD